MKVSFFVIFLVISTSSIAYASYRYEYTFPYLISVSCSHNAEKTRSVKLYRFNPVFRPCLSLWRTTHYLYAEHIQFIFRRMPSCTAPFVSHEFFNYVPPR